MQPISRLNTGMAFSICNCRKKKGHRTSLKLSRSIDAFQAEGQVAYLPAHLFNHECFRVYYVTVNIKTPDGMLEIGRYFLGAERSFAEETFSALKGSDNVKRYPFIRLDLINTSAELLPVCLKNMGCDLAQYTYNCKILAREVFRHFMFEGEASL